MLYLHMHALYSHTNPHPTTTHTPITTQVADLGSVIHLIGGTAAGLLTLGMPGLLLINSVIDVRVWVRTGMCMGVRDD